MFFSKKKKRKRFLCLRILCFFGIKDYSVPQNSNELLLEYDKMFRPVRLARQENPEAPIVRPERAEGLQQHALFYSN